MTQRVNDGMINLLKLEPSTKYSFGDNQHNVPHAFRRAASRTVRSSVALEGLSADLSKASDYIQFSVARAVMDGFREAMGPTYINDTMFDHVLNAIGPMELAPPSEDEREVWRESGLLEKVGETTQRGILMGLSLTWPILSVLNMYSASYTLKSDLTRPPEVRRKPCFTICGDDLGAIWEPERTELYFRKLTDVGLVVNKSKSYRSRSLRVIFVERLFTVGKIIELKKQATEAEILADPRIRNTLFSWIAVALGKANGKEELTHNLTYQSYRSVSLVPRVKMSALALSKRSGRRDDEDKAPAWVVLPDVYTEQLRNAVGSWRKARMLDLLPVLHPKTYRMYKQSGIPLSWPKELGGWGFPGKQHANDRWRKAAASILTHSDAYAMLNDLSAIHIVEGLPENIRTRVKRGMEYVEEYCVPTEDSAVGKPRLELQKDVVEATTSAFRLAQGDFRTKPSNFKFASVSRRIKRKVNESAELWKSAQPMKPAKVIKLMSETLDARNAQLLDASQLLMIQARIGVTSGIFRKTIEGLPTSLREMMFLRTDISKRSDEITSQRRTPIPKGVGTANNTYLERRPANPNPPVPRPIVDRHHSNVNTKVGSETVPPADTGLRGSVAGRLVARKRQVVPQARSSITSTKPEKKLRFPTNSRAHSRTVKAVKLSGTDALKLRW
jgi:hypothetical protein